MLVSLYENKFIYIDISLSPSNVCENSMVLYCGKCCLLTVTMGNFQKFRVSWGMSSYMVQIAPLVYWVLLSTVTVFSLCFRVFQNMRFLFHCESVSF